MPKFNYKARGKDGKEITGYKDAADRFELARILRNSGELLISAEDAAAPGKKSIGGINISFKFLGRLKRVKLTDKMIFSKNLGVMVGAGMSLPRALDALARETHNPKFKTIIAGVVDKLKQGKTFAESLGVYPEVFPSLYISMIEAGEKSGKLQDSLAVLASQMQADYDLVRKVRGAMIYPGIIMIAMVLIGVLMMVFVVPTLTATFKELNVELPASTRFIIALSDVLLNYGIFVLLGVILLGVGLWRAKKTPTGKNFLDTVFIKAPLLGTLDQKFNAARSARTLSSLLAAGVQILEALDIASRVIQNHFYVAVLAEARTEVQKGEPISKIFLAHEDLYPALMAEMLAVGEETGQTPKMLEEVAKFYETQVADATRDLSTIIEPVLMILIGAVVGFFAVSMITPMYSLSGAI